MSSRTPRGRPPGRCCSHATPTRLTRSDCAAPTRRARCSSTATPAPPILGCRGGRTFDGAWPYLDADSRRQRDRRSARPARRRGLLGRQRAARPGQPELSSHDTSTIASAGASAAPANTSIDTVAAGAVPHHCFHVFAVYPWLGLLRTGIVDQPLHILDQCRTTPAVVESVDAEDALTVSARPLLWEDGMSGSRRSRHREPCAGERMTSRLSPNRARVTSSRCIGTSSVTSSSPRSARALLAANQRAILAVNQAGAAAQVLS